MFVAGQQATVIISQILNYAAGSPIGAGATNPPAGMPAVTSLAGTEQIPVFQGSGWSVATIDQVAAWINSAAIPALALAANGATLAYPSVTSFKSSDTLVILQGGGFKSLVLSQLTTITRLRALGYKAIGNRTGPFAGRGSGTPETAAYAAGGGATTRHGLMTGASQAYTAVRIAYCGFWLTTGFAAFAGHGEQALTSSITHKAYLENGTASAISFAGAASVTVNPGDGFTFSDPIGALPANTQVEFRDYATVPAGGKLAQSNWATLGNSANANIVAAGIGADAANGTGALSLVTANTTGAATNPAIAPHLLVGIPTTPSTHRNVAIIGDSIAAGYGDPSTIAYLGFIQRQLTNAIDWTDFAKAGALMLNWGTTHPYSMGALALFDNVICQGLTNDIYGSVVPPNLATVLAIAIDCWSRFTAQGPRVFQTTIIPRLTSANLTNPALQVLADANQELVRTSLNDWLRAGAPMVGGVAVAIGTSGALVAGNTGHPLKGVFDPCSLVECDTTGTLTTNGGRIVAPGGVSQSADGTHLNTAGAILAAPSIILASLNA